MTNRLTIALIGLCLIPAMVLSGCGEGNDGGGENIAVGGHNGGGGSNTGGGGNNNGGGGGGSNTGSAVTVTTPGAPANMLSGNKALIAVSRSKSKPGPGAPHYEEGNLSPSNITVTLNGKKVTNSFKEAKLAGDEGSAVLGRIKGLHKGNNTLTVRNGNGPKTSLTLIDYPLSGPIFSGPQEEPYICQTEASGLGGSNKNCMTATQTQYKYLSSGSNSFESFDLNGPRPNDIAATTTSDGQKVPFIVRVETGTINRAIYSIAILDDPAQPGPTPWEKSEGWNGRLVYAFGGGCGPGHHQGNIKASSPPALKKSFLSQGYAVATSTLNTLRVNCNTVLSAETALMVKQHFAQTYGIPVYTIGKGGSGGAIQQYQIADNYPGILDGITPSHAFPDPLIAPGVSDCGLLVHYFKNSSLKWTATEKAAVSGEGTFHTCKAWNVGFVKLLKASVRCSGSIPNNLIYDATTNPDGIRCTLQDHLVDILGTNPDTGFARDPLDNVGVQYGLNALDNGVITKAQFINLNRKIGGYDVDGNIIKDRRKGDVEALKTIYEVGGLTTAEGGLPTTPIIDWRPYQDLQGGIHTRFYSFSVRRRLLKASGTADNQVILVEPPGASDITPFSTVESMDQWLANIRMDGSSTQLAKKVAADKPAGLVDACYDQSGNKIEHPASYDSNGQCNELYPPFGDPRVGAGEPIALNVLKCQLKPVAASDYSASVNFTDQQIATLKSIFPKGVCDYSRPSVGKAPYQGPGISFAKSASSSP